VFCTWDPLTPKCVSGTHCLVPWTNYQGHGTNFTAEYLGPIILDLGHIADYKGHIADIRGPTDDYIGPIIMYLTS